MSLDTMITEMTFFGVFLVPAFLLREIVKPIQKLFIPSSIIGGVIALVGGQQILGLWEVPSSFGSYSGTLIRFVMCALIFGVTLNLEKLKSYADYMMVVHSVYGWQMALGIALGAFMCIIWPSLPVGWGFQGVQSFYGGHGQAGAAGAVFEELTGSTDITSIGMVLSTFRPCLCHDHWHGGGKLRRAPGLGRVSTGTPEAAASFLWRGAAPRRRRPAWGQLRLTHLD